jgi:Fur family peroxide stress response transcriptional regulator
VRLAACIAAIEARCQQLGVALTGQRRAVIEVLAGRGDHPTADDVFVALARRRLGIGKATVYRTLDALAALGVIVRVAHPGSVARFDARADRHHHLVCDACGAMHDLDHESYDGLRLPSTRATGFVAHDYSVQVRGLCARCAKPRGRPTNHKRRRRQE